MSDVMKQDEKTPATMGRRPLFERRFLGREFAKA